MTVIIGDTSGGPDGVLAFESGATAARPVRPDFEFDVAIVGLGYVGLPTAIAFYTAGSSVLGVDISDRRLGVILRGEADLLERDQSRLRRAVHDPRFEMSSDPSLLQRAAAVIVCVPTPVDEYLIPDLSLLRSACQMVVANAVAGQLLVLTSTTYVGCTTDFLVTPLASRGFQVGTDVFVAFSAERIDPGNSAFEQEEVPRVVGGATPQCEAEAAVLLSRYAMNVHQVGSLAVAEMTKLLENTFRAVNIALANEFADICAALDLDVNSVIDAAATKPYGFMAFRPGPGVGGHCIPCDPHYLLWQLRRERISAPVIEQAMHAIAGRPRQVVERARNLLSDRGMGLSGARILVVGVSYKPNVADLRESPALEILESLSDEGALVAYLDDHFPSITLPNGQTMHGVTDPQFYLADLVLLHTTHAGVDLSWVAERQIVLDTTYRNTTIPQAVLL